MTNPVLALPATEKARWLLDLRRFLPLKPQFVVSGNVRDHQLSEVTPGASVPVSLAAALRSELREAGFAVVLYFDPVNGFRPLLAPGEELQTALSAMAALGLQPDAQGHAPAGIELLAATLARIAGRTGISDGEDGMGRRVTDDRNPQVHHADSYGMVRE